jgi:gamma-glutamyl hydrolase
LSDFFTLLATTADALGKVYVSMAEAKRYPFVAVQWHPEKSPFEFGRPEMPHSLAAVQLAQAVADAFVQVCLPGEFVQDVVEGGCLRCFDRGGKEVP